MFEKEAEEYAKQNNPAEYGVRATHFTVLNSFKDGAEFGFQKGIKARINTTTISDCPIKDEKLAYAKNIIQDLLDNSDEYARQRAIDYLKEGE